MNTIKTFTMSPGDIALVKSGVPKVYMGLGLFHGGSFDVEFVRQIGCELISRVNTILRWKSHHFVLNRLRR